MTAALTVAAFAAMTLLLGALLAATPYLIRPDECFAVTVPSSSRSDPRLVALKRGYVRTVALTTAASTALAIVAGILLVRGGGDGSGAGAVAGTVLECVAVLGPCVASFLLMLRNRRRVMAVKREEGWAATGSERVAVVGEQDVPRPISLVWNLLYVVVMLATAALGLALYPSMPDPIPMHADFAGNVNGWVEKSVGSVFGFPLAMEAFLGLVFLVCHVMMIYAKHPTDPGAPATSALAYGLFARAQSVFMLATGVVVSGALGIGFMLSSAGIVTLGQMGGAIVVLVLVTVAGAVALSVVYGQNGARLFRRMKGSDAMPRDDDEHWKLGVLYFNREDPSVFLPERFGIGWTVNFARPAAWALLGGLVAVVGIVVAAVLLLT